jgi:hypothetical protein
MSKNGDKFSWCVVAIAATEAEEALVERALEDLRGRGITVFLLPGTAARLRDAYDSEYDDKVKVN